MNSNDQFVIWLSDVSDDEIYANWFPLQNLPARYRAEHKLCVNLPGHITTDFLETQEHSVVLPWIRRRRSVQKLQEEKENVCTQSFFTAPDPSW